MAAVCGQPSPTPEEQQTMCDLHEQGYSVREIARVTGWAKATVSRYLRIMGADTDRSKTAEATAARVRKMDERRIDLAEMLMDDAFSLQHRTWDKYEMVVSSAEGPQTVHLTEPPLREQADAVKALSLTVDTIDRLTGKIGTDEAANAKNVLTNLVHGLVQLVGPADGLSEHDRDHDYDITTDPEESKGGTATADGEPDFVWADCDCEGDCDCGEVDDDTDGQVGD